MSGIKKAFMKNRVTVVKFLVVAVVGVRLFSSPAYSEGSIIDLILEISGYTLLSIAAFGRTWASAYISGKKNRSLITTGPYSVVRNPLYFFSFIGFVGAGLVFESIVTAVAFSLIFFLAHWPAIRREENKLSGLFPESYGNYKSRVPRFIPRPWLLNSPDIVALSRNKFSKALLESWLIMCVFPVAHIIEWAQAHSILPVVFKLY